jgi:ligand-binding sensor domain-containing protein
MASAKGLFRADLGCRFVLALLTIVARAEQLPIRIYGPADGFPSKTVEAITKDLRGFLWFATPEGLAQFDGYEFRTFRKANGLPRDAVNDFLETRSGIYWAATSDGVAKFDPSERPERKFTVYRSDRPVSGELLGSPMFFGMNSLAKTRGTLFKIGNIVT